MDQSSSAHTIATAQSGAISTQAETSKGKDLSGPLLTKTHTDLRTNENTLRQETGAGYRDPGPRNPPPEHMPGQDEKSHLRVTVHTMETF